jgi:hypothetical protein
MYAIVEWMKAEIKSRHKRMMVILKTGMEGMKNVVKTSLEEVKAMDFQLFLLYDDCGSHSSKY